MESRRYSELSAVLEQALVLSKVRESERVVLVHPYVGYNPRIVEGLRVGLNNLGADFIRLELPPRARGLRQVRPLGVFGAEILKAADMVVRVSPRPPLTPDISMYDTNFSDVLFGGTRWLDFMRRRFNLAAVPQPAHDRPDLPWGGAHGEGGGRPGDV